MQLRTLGRVACAATLAFTFPLAALAQTSASQDMKNAGNSTKSAAKSAGSGISTGTKKAYHKTKRGTKKAAHKVSGDSNTK